MGKSKHYYDSSDESIDPSTDSHSDTDSTDSDDSRSNRRHDDSDDERLIPEKHSKHGKKSKKRRRKVGGSSAPVHGNITLVGCVVAGVIVLILAGAYYVYQKNGSLLPPSTSGSDSSESGGSTGGSDSEASSGGGKSSGGATGAGSGAGSTGSASKGDEGGGSKTASGTDSAGETASKTSSEAEPSSTGGSSSGGGGGGGKVTAFFENWLGQDPATTDFTGLYAAFWFCAVPEAGGSVDILESTAGQAKAFAEAAQKGGAKALLSVGGWTGSALFSGLVAKEDTRKAFVDAMVKAMEDSSFDGIDIDWEYPGKAGATEDFDVKVDLANLLLLLQELREKIGDDKILSMDTSSGVYNGPDGNPSSDMSEFGKVLDFITIMTYDSVTYSSKTTGPNFAFSSKCATSGATYEIPTTVQAWIDAKFPADKISVGLASYGYAWTVDDFKDGGGVEGASSSIYQTVSKVLDVKDGSVPYSKIVSEYLDKMDYTFDDCTSTPFLYSSDTKLFIAYDDEKSFATKGGYAKENGLFGCSVYAGLTQDSDGKLIKAAIDAC
ncbi:hypothetical protein JCM5353_001283 [Sporobolomyces roseus]